MNWVADGIAIGGIRDALDAEYLRREGVQSVLQLYGPDPAPNPYPFGEAVLQLRVLDGIPIPPELIRQGTAFVREQRQAGRNVLVCCGAGRSRSPAFVAAYMHEQGSDLQEAYRAIMERRKEVLPHPALLRPLLDCYGLTDPPEQLLTALLRYRRQQR